MAVIALAAHLARLAIGVLVVAIAINRAAQIGLLDADIQAAAYLPKRAQARKMGRYVRERRIALMELSLCCAALAVLLL